ncbi:hypothetical protein AeNC1_009766 [Aphanomyces euteiches]|nr:hypothetical protein AeNC1_009766 [Aphanomyces euteiches]
MILKSGVVGALVLILVPWALYFAERFFPQDVSSDLVQLGSISSSSVKVWLFSTAATKAHVSYDDQDGEHKSLLFDFDENHPTLTVLLSDLNPETQYNVTIELLEANNQILFTDSVMFKTLGSNMSRVRFAFGSCTMAIPLIHPFLGFSSNLRYIATTLRPDFMLLLGDQIYADVDISANAEQLYRTTIHDDAYQAIGRSTPLFTMYDDHEIYNNWNAGPDDPLYQESIQLYERYFGDRNPARLEPGEHYYSWKTGVAAFFMLDVRKYASPKYSPDGPTKTKLGATQKDHFLSWLQSSTEPFKIVISSMVVSDLGQQAVDEGWALYQTEYLEIASFIKSHNISGVVLLSGDLHFAGVFQHTPFDFLFEE